MINPLRLLLVSNFQMTNPGWGCGFHDARLGVDGDAIAFAAQSGSARRASFLRDARLSGFNSRCLRTVTNPACRLPHCTICGASTEGKRSEDNHKAAACCGQSPCDSEISSPS